MQSAAGHSFFSIEYRSAGLHRLARAVMLIALVLLLGGCGPAAGESAADTAAAEIPAEALRSDGGGETPVNEGSPAADLTAESLLSGNGGSVDETAGTEEIPAEALLPAGQGAGAYTAPAPLVSSFHKDKAKGENGILIDVSAASDGYIGVSGTSSGRLKFQSIKDGNTYTYDMKSDGTPSIFPLQMEDGMYTFRVLENVSGSKYAVLYTTDETISISNPFGPYLCSSDYVKYTDASACVKKAKEFAAGAADVNGLIKAVYDYVCAGVTYDRDKAKTVQAGYMPDPDETLATGKGICFDYASLAAAMLRSQGIPCKVIFGYVSPNEVYHAWNMFYTEDNGWITVKFEISGKKWNRMDLTFSSNGADGNFIGDGSNYKDVYCY